MLFDRSLARTKIGSSAEKRRSQSQDGRCESRAAVDDNRSDATQSAPDASDTATDSGNSHLDYPVRPRIRRGFTFAPSSHSYMAPIDGYGGSALNGPASSIFNRAPLATRNLHQIRKQNQEDLVAVREHLAAKYSNAGRHGRHAPSNGSPSSNIPQR